MNTLSTAHALWKCGLAVLWLHSKEKRPIGNWKGIGRQDWPKLKKAYRADVNLGVLLGTPSKLDNGYLACLDIDVKTNDPKHRLEAVSTAKNFLLHHWENCPVVASGSGNGSRHLYFASPQPFEQLVVARSKETVQLPGHKKVSAAWEVVAYSTGRQMVLPPSIHPNGKPYVWKRSFDRVLPLITVQGGHSNESKAPISPLLDDFKAEIVEVEWLGLSTKTLGEIVTGEGVSDRSAALFKIAKKLYAVGLNQHQVLSVLTDPHYFIGQVGYDHAQTKSRKRAAEWLWKFTVKDADKERNVDAVFGEVVDRKLNPSELTQQTEIFEDISWQSSLRKTEKGNLKNTIQNVVLVLTNAVHEKIVRRDGFSFKDTFGVDTPWGDKRNELVSDRSASRIRLWLGQHFNFEPNKDLIFDAVWNIADQNTYDPVRDYLDNLPKWDGKPRLQIWLKKNFEAKGDEEYLAQVFVKWMVAQVMRVYKPGAKFDWMPIFEGQQGIGKSSFGRLLCGEKYFSDWLPNLGDKDAALGLRGMRIIEMGELATLRKNELEVVKGFITRQTDKIRPPYGKIEMEFDRRCVFFGTTNQQKYLKDETGNRRFKPIMVGQLNFHQLEKDRDQLYAEAKHLWDSETLKENSLELTGNAKKSEIQMHSDKTIEDGSDLMAQNIAAYFHEKGRNGLINPDRFRVAELFQSGGSPLFGWPGTDYKYRLATKALRKLNAKEWPAMGYHYWKVTIGGDQLPLAPSGELF